MEMNPYLTFPGTCAEAFEFYAEVFGGEVTMKMPAGDSPMAADMGADKAGWMLHARVRIGDRLLMGSDDFRGTHQPARGFHVQVGFDDVDRAARVFSRLAKNGTTEAAFGPTFWAAGFGSCHDRYGVPWMINCETGPEGH